MYENVETKELELLLKQTERELKLYTKYNEMMKVNDENYNAQVNLLLDDIKNLLNELKRRM
jgi:hypothetical protein